jgi:rod shape-determining protein MreC
MNLFSRHKNTVVLATVLLAQLLALAVQVKRQTAEGPVRVIRLVAVNTIAPFERLFIYSGESVRGVWSNYLDLRDVRREDLRLRAQLGQMRLEHAQAQEEVRQARRMQVLLGFKEKWIDGTVAAQVIGTSGMETSRLLYLDKGAKDGIRADMPVITPDGLVGKVLTVYGETSQILMINDLTSGVGAILVNSRLQGIVKGTPTGEVQMNYIMSDEAVQSGEALVTSGGDRVFPKGLPIGTVSKVGVGHDLFLDIKVKPAVDLNRLEEVLVITEQKPRAPDATGLGAIRAADILAGHLPGVPVAPPANASPATSPAAPAAPKPASPNGDRSKPKTVAAPATPNVDRPKPKLAAAAPKPASPTAERPKPKTGPSEGTHPQ